MRGNMGGGMGGGMVHTPAQANTNTNTNDHSSKVTVHAPTPAPAPAEKEETPKWDCMQKLKLGSALVAGFLSFILALVAYLAWAGSVGDFNGVVDNWVASPVTDLVWTADANNCPALHSSILARVQYNIQNCTTSTTSSSDPTGVSSTASSTSCQSKTENWDLKFIRSAYYLCIRHEGPNAVTRLRTDPTDPDCPTDMQYCGGDVCWPVGISCPLSEARSSSAGMSGTPIAFNHPTQSGYSIYAHRNSTYLAPLPSGGIVDIVLARGGSPCMGLRNPPLYSTSSINCGGIANTRDPLRYQVAVTGVAQPALFTENRAPAEMLNTWNDYDGTASTQWNLWVRREIYWSPSCPQSRESVIDMQNRINSIDASQLAVLIISIFGLMYDCYATWRIYKELTNNDPSDDMHTIKLQIRINIVTDACVLIPTLVAVGIAYTSRSFFDSMKDSVCSDDATNGTFQFLGTEVSKIGGIGVAKAVLCALYLAYRLFTVCRQKNKVAPA